MGKQKNTTATTQQTKLKIMILTTQQQQTIQDAVSALHNSKRHELATELYEIIRPSPLVKIMIHWQNEFNTGDRIETIEGHSGFKVYTARFGYVGQRNTFESAKALWRDASECSEPTYSEA